jgi:hypothetical protein
MNGTQTMSLRKFKATPQIGDVMSVVAGRNEIKIIETYEVVSVDKVNREATVRFVSMRLAK